MQTRLVPVNEETLNDAAQIIREGGVVGFPTETVYGLGADALNADAVRRIFEAKGRPGDNPLIVHVSREEDIAPLIEGDIPECARKLMRDYWPGPMTIIMKKSKALPDAVTAGLDTVGIRMPVHEDARRFIEACGCPIAAPSANLSGRPSPTTAQHVMEDMSGRVPMILDGGKCDVGLESTVIDATIYPPRVLRPGGITAEMIAQSVGAVEVDGSVLRPIKEGEVVRSPGMKYRHYAPKGNVTIVEGDAQNVAKVICEKYDEAVSQGKSACLLCLDGNAPLYGERRMRLLGKDAWEMAANLFDALREMDEIGAEVILSEAVATDGVGLAVMNRLGRAASFQIINV